MSVLRKIEFEKYSHNFFVNAYGKSRGFVNITSSGNQYGLIIPTYQVSKYNSRYDYINHECLNDDNRKITLNTFMDNTSLSEKNLNDLSIIAIKTNLPEYWSVCNFSNISSIYLEELFRQLNACSRTELMPTHIVCSDAVYLLYVLNKNVHLGHCKGNKKDRIIKFVKHIQTQLCKTLELCTQNNFEPVPLTASIHIPNSPYVVFSGEFDKTKRIMKSKVIDRGITRIATPENCHLWESLESLADVAGMPRYNTYRKNSKIPVKHHIKNRDFYGINAMLERRLKLIKSVMKNKFHGFYSSVCLSETLQTLKEISTFLYFNFYFELYEDYDGALRAAALLLREIFPNDNEDIIEYNITKLGIPAKLFNCGHGYKYTDEKLFEALSITREEAATYAYTTADKKNYDKMYSHAKRLAEREQKEKNNAARWQKTAIIKEKIISLKTDGLSYRKIAEELKMSVSNIFYHLNSQNNSAKFNGCPI